MASLLAEAMFIWPTGELPQNSQANPTWILRVSGEELRAKAVGLMTSQSTNNCDYLTQQNLAAKLFQEAVAKGARRIASPSITLWLQLKPRSDSVGTAGRQYRNSVNAISDRMCVRRKLVTALAQYQGPEGFLFSGK